MAVSSGMCPALSDCSNIKGSVMGTVSNRTLELKLPFNIQIPYKGPVRNKANIPNWLTLRNSKYLWAPNHPF